MMKIEQKELFKAVLIIVVSIAGRSRLLANSTRPAKLPSRRV